MANSFTVVKHWSDTKILWAVITLKLSGSVPAGGELLNLASTTALKAHPASVPLGAENPIVGTGISLGQYELYFINGTNMSNGKLLLTNYATGATLQPGQAYPAIITQDTFTFNIMLRKYVDLG
jgi:hypothetical protein